MAVIIATLVTLGIVLIFAYILKLAIFKIKVRPEYDSKAVELWAQRHFAKHNQDLNKEEKCIRFIELDIESKQLLEAIEKDNNHKQIKRPLAK